MPSLAEHADAIATQYLSEGIAVQPGYTGRLSELAHPDVLTKLFNAIADGNYVTTATRLAGISQDTYQRWLRRAEAEPESAYALFATAVKEAECAAEAAIVADVRKAARKEQFWAAGMTLLERKYPDKWGRRNEDQTAPRVVVQIGAGAGEVKVGIIQPTFASETSTVSVGLHSLTGDVESNNNELCKPTTALSVGALGQAEADRQLPASESPGGPYPGGVSAGGQASLPQVKEAKSVRRPRKKKGHGSA